MEPTKLSGVSDGTNAIVVFDIDGVIRDVGGRIAER